MLRLGLNRVVLSAGREHHTKLRIATRPGDTQASRPYHESARFAKIIHYLHRSLKQSSDRHTDLRTSFDVRPPFAQALT